MATKTGTRPFSTHQPATLTTLPPELHLQISQHLSYPDALSLRYTNRHFSRLVDTGVRLKVAWLVERRALALQVPNDRGCDLRSDGGFCRGSVRTLIRRHRQHLECESRPGLGCLVFGTTRCAHRLSFLQRFRRHMRSRVLPDLCWTLLALVPVLLGCLWMVELVKVVGWQ
ncbi:hypothetical protein GGR56DRAFT_515132 [Xylariaceae sp. FL0804]|nr:hypothetical protein GGR56DRAFT_515132 [Xylariaceae sp. FL0804]